MYDDLHFAEPLYHDIAGRRFEPHFEPEWQAWCVIDRQCGRLHRCVDERSATREAASLEAVRRLVENVAHHFAV